jgi:hypothetical protein
MLSIEGAKKEDRHITIEVKLLTMNGRFWIEED